MRQYRSLAQAFADESEIEMFQVPQPAVDEFCRSTGRAGGEIALFDQRDTQATQRRVEGQAGAGYSAADNQDVEDFFGEFKKRFTPRAPGKFSPIHILDFIASLALIVGSGADRNGTDVQTAKKRRKRGKNEERN
jgi:hypothetical protein